MAAGRGRGRGTPPSDAKCLAGVWGPGYGNAALLSAFRFPGAGSIDISKLRDGYMAPPDERPGSRLSLTRPTSSLIS